MDTREWALVIFTLLSQAAVGAFLTLQVLRSPLAPGGAGVLTPPGTGEGGIRRAGPSIAVLVVLSAGFVAALFHLATPLSAVRAVVNFTSSWLSREIVFGGLFAGLLAALVAVEYSGRSFRWHRLLAGATAAAALAFLYSQIRIYMLPAQPAWNSLATPAAFTTTTLRLGILGVAVGLVTRGVGPTKLDATSWRILRGLAVAGIVVLAAELLVVPLQLGSLIGDPSAAAVTSAQSLTQDYRVVLVLRLVLLGAGAAALGGLLVSHRGPDANRLARTLTFASFWSVLLSELCGRFLFYATAATVGI
jgi:anaerobic dimethyl sulfoxide reductase subunit C (anchor subunit)